jgi:hypothetical protein
VGSAGPCPSALTVDWACLAPAAWTLGCHPVAFLWGRGLGLGG